MRQSKSKSDDGDAKATKKQRRRTSAAQLYIDLAKGNGTIADPTIRQDLMRLHILGELGRLNGERLKATRAAGGDIPGMGNISKLSMSDMVRLQRDVGLRIVGPAGTLHAYSDDQRAPIEKATGNPFLPMVTGTALYAQAPPIYGGTDQIQRNIIGERVLGLAQGARRHQHRAVLVVAQERLRYRARRRACEVPRRKLVAC